MTTSRRPWLWALVGIGLAIICVALVTSTIVSAVNSSLIRQSQVTNTRTLDSTEETAELIRSCTVRGGSCYEESQERTGAAVSDISRVTVLAAACAASLDGKRLDVPTRAARIQACVVDQLDPPSP